MQGTRLVVSTQPTDAGAVNGDAVSGQIFATQPVIEVEDGFGNLDVDYASQVSVALASGAGVLAGDASVAVVDGQTQFTDLAYSATGDQESFSLTASSGSLTAATTAVRTADVVAQKLVFTAQPADVGADNGDVVSGQTFATQPAIQARDADDLKDQNFSGQIDITLGSGAGNLSGTLNTTAAAGVAQFSNLIYSATSDQESFSLRASSGSLTATTAAVTADVVATQLVFTTQPADVGADNGDVVSGQSFATQPAIQARDADDLKDQNFAGQIDITLGSGAGNLSGTLSTTAAAGAAQFSNLVYSATSDQESFSLRASSGSLTAATTAAVTADVVAQKLVFTAQLADVGAVNGDVVSGQAFATQPAIQARDADDLKDQNFAGQIDIALASGAGSLSGTLNTTAASGDAQFSNLIYSATSDQESFSLRASSGNLTAATTAVRTADVVAQKLVFTIQPADVGADNGDVVSGQSFATQPTIQARDADNLKDQNFTAQIDIALASGAGNLSGTLSATAAAGAAQFSNLVYSATSDQESFSLRASSGSLTATTTAAVTADVVATQLVFTTQPADAGADNGNVVSGQAFATQPVLEAQDANGVRDINLNAGSALIAVVPDTLMLSGTTAKVWNSGVADFAGLGLAVAVAEDQVVFNLTASGSSLAAATSAALTADVVATQIAFATEPADIDAVNGDVVSGQVFATQPVLEAQDANNVRDIHVSSGTAALEINSGAVTLSGSTSANWSSGQANFSGLAAVASDQVNFTLGATSTGFSQSISGNLTADVVATQAAFVTEPSDIGAVNGDVVSGQAFATQPVLEAQNADGIRDQDINSGSAVLGVESGAVLLAGTATENWSAGRADFSGNDLSVSGSNDGISFVLSGSSGGLVQASTSTLRSDVVATQLLFATSPAHANVISGDVITGQAFATQPVVQAQNGDAIVDADFDDQVTLSVDLPGQLNGTLSVAATAGVAQFSDVAYTASVDQETFQLRADDGAGGGEGDLSAVVDSTSIRADVVATQIAFTSLPADNSAVDGDVVSGQVFATQPVLEAQDANGIRDLNLSGSVSLSSGDVVLGGTTNKTWINGRADFVGSQLQATASVDNAVFSLIAESGALQGQASGLRADVVATQIAFAISPSDGGAVNGDVVNGQSFAAQAVLEAWDANGIRDLQIDSGSVSVSIGSGSVNLTGATARTWVDGRADFAGLEMGVSGSVDGASFSLAAQAAGLSDATGSTLVNDVVATRLVFAVSPAHAGVANGDVRSGTPFASQPVIEGRDISGQVDIHFADRVTLSVDGSGQLGGTATATAVAGVAQFADLVYSAAADQEIFQLRADDEEGGGEGDLPQTVDPTQVTADVEATRIVLATPPADDAATNGDVVNGVPFAVQPVCEAQDDDGIRDGDFNGTVELSVASGNIVLTGNAAESLIGGRADFLGNALVVNGNSDGIVFTLTAQTAGLEQSTSAALVNDVVATQMVFTTSPSDDVATNGDVVNGTPFATQPVIEAQDGNDVRDLHISGDLVSLAISSGSVSLSGENAVNWANGMADFDGSMLAVEGGDGASFTLTASSGSLPDLSLDLVNDVVGAQMVFLTPPADHAAVNGDVVNGVPFATQPVLALQDNSGAVDLDASGSVMLSVESGEVSLDGETTLDWTDGVADFSAAALEVAGVDGASFTLTASSGSLPDLSLDLVNDVVTSRMVFTTPPADDSSVNGDVVNGMPFATQPILALQDNSGGIDRNVSGSVILSVSGGGVSLNGVKTLSWTDGVADFSNSALSITGADGASFTLTASSGSLPDLSLDLVSDVVGTQMMFTTPPSDGSAVNGDVVNGMPFATQPILTVQDSGGAVDRDASGSITLSVDSGEVSLSGVTTLGWTDGVADFSAAALAVLGADEASFTLRARSGSLPDLSLDLINDVVTSRMVFLTPPADDAAVNGDVVNGVPFATQPVLAVQDMSGGIDRNVSGSATLSINGSGVNLSGVTTLSWTDGVADFSAAPLVVTGADGASFTLTVSSGSLPDLSLDLINDVVGTQLVFSAPPSDNSAVNGDVVSGVPFAVQPVLAVQDSSGAVDLDASGSATLSVNSGEVGLSGVTTLGWTNGVADFSTAALAVLGADGTSFTLTASNSSLPNLSIDLVSDVVGTQMVFTTPPTDDVAVNGDVVNGSPFATQPLLAVQDSDGIVDRDVSGSVSLSVESGEVSLAGVTAVDWTNGVADFSSAALAALGADGASFTLTASSGSLPHLSLDLVNDVVGTRMVFTTPPSDDAAVNGDVANGMPFATQPVLALQDSSGAVDRDATGSATLSVDSGEVSLSGVTAVDWTNGVADFSAANLSVTGADGASFTLTASSGSLPQSSIDLVNDVVISRIVFVALPSDSLAVNGDVVNGSPFATQPVLEIQDISGTVDQNASGSVSLSVSGNGVVLNGVTTLSWTNGVADFSAAALSVKGADGDSFTLTASSGALPQSSIDLVDDVVGTQMVFTTPPADDSSVNGDVVNGSPFATQPVLMVQDSGGAVDRDASGSVTLSVDSSEVSLHGVATLNWTNGVADFSAATLSVKGVDGVSFTLTASSDSLPDLNIDLVNDVVNSRMVFLTPPSDSAAINGDVVNTMPFATQPVLAVQDSGGSIDRDISGSVTLSTSGNGVVLNGVTTLSWTNGMADFRGAALSVKGVDGASFTLTASSGSLADLNIDLVNDVVGTQMAFTTPPSDGAAINGDVVNAMPFATQPVLAVQDSGGWMDRDASGSVTLSVAPAGISLNGISTSDWTNGTADFRSAALSVKGVDGASFTLTASSGTLPDLSIDLVDDVVATQIVFTTPPADSLAANGDVVSGVPFAVQPVLAAQDSSGGIDRDVSGPVRVLVGSGSVELNGISALSWTDGMVDFSGSALSVEGDDGSPFALTAISGALPQSNIELINDVVTTQLVFVQQPAHSGVPAGTVIHGLPFEFQPVVEARDGNGRLDRDIDGELATIAVQFGAARLTGLELKDWESGRADFASRDIGLEVEVDGERAVLQVTSPRLPPALSETLTVDIRATRLILLDTVKTRAHFGEELLTGSWRIVAVHRDGKKDVNFSGSISLGAVMAGTDIAADAPLRISPAAVALPSAGETAFTAVQYQGVGTIQLQASSPGLEAARSDTIRVGGSLKLQAPTNQVVDQLSLLRGAVPLQLPLVAFDLEAAGEVLLLQQLATTVELDGGLQSGNIAQVQLLVDLGAIGQIDAADQVLAATALRNGRAVFTNLNDPVEARHNYLIAWSPAGPLEEAWTINGQVASADVRALSQVAGAVSVQGDTVAGLEQRVGALGPLHRIELSAAPDTLTADSLSTAELTVRILDAFGQTLSYDSQSIVTFKTISGSALIGGSTAAMADSGRASTTLLAGTTPGIVQVGASLADGPADTVEIVLQPDAIAAVELSATPSLLHLDQSDQIAVRAVLRDRRDNIVALSAENLRFTLIGAGQFPNLSTSVHVAVLDGAAGTTIQVARAGSLQVEAAFGELTANVDIVAISSEVPRVDLEAEKLTLPADGSRAISLTATLLDGPNGPRAGDDTTRIHFSVASGHALLSEPTERAVVQGQARIQLQGLGIAGPIVVRAEVEGMEAGEIALTAVASSPVGLDLVALPSQLRADGLSTTILAAVVRDPLGNIAVDADVDIDFAIEAGEAEIIGPVSVPAAGGTARTTLRSSVRTGQVAVRATAQGLSAGTTTVELVAGAPAKLSLQATSDTLLADSTATVQLIATVQDLYGNAVLTDSTTLVSFSVSGGPGAINGSAVVRVSDGRAQTELRATGATGQILVFAGAVDLVPATTALEARQIQTPEFKNLPEQVQLLEDGDAVRLSIADLVEDGDTAIEDLHFSFAPDTLSLSVAVEEGELIFQSVEPDFFGAVTVHLTVRDPTALESSASLVVEVLPRNDLPLITSVPDTLTFVDTLYIYQVQAFDADGDRLEYRLVQGPPGMGFDRTLHRAVWPPRTTGVFSLRFLVSDGIEEVEQSFSVRVLAPENRLRFVSDPPTRVHRGDLFTYRPSVIDPAELPISYHLEEGPAHMRVNATTGLLNWIVKGTDLVEAVDVVLVASNGLREARQRFRIRLEEHNNPPAILSEPETVTWVDSLYIYPMEAIDVDGDTLIFQIVQGPTKMRVNSLAGIFAWEPGDADAGETELVLAAYDGQLAIEQRYILEILQQPAMQPPRISTPNGLALDPAAGHTATLALNLLVVDPDHADSALTWTIAHLAGDQVMIHYNRTTQMARFTTASDFTAAQVSLQVTDPDGLNAATTLNLAVRQSGDLNNDTAIDQDDLVSFAESFGARQEEQNRWNATADLNGDGRVDFADFFLFMDRLDRDGF